ncbi:hypothetical protein [Tumebacillus lipolyticus]|uniref:YtkA-like domain-containing protein n=1 Tax=Tumebacillus lipolyticus TaxID=1280370 RepID=A0ABW4ZYK5_9BACL
MKKLVVVATTLVVMGMFAPISSAAPVNTVTEGNHMEIASVSPDTYSSPYSTKTFAYLYFNGSQSLLIDYTRKVNFDGHQSPSLGDTLAPSVQYQLENTSYPYNTYTASTVSGTGYFSGSFGVVPEGVYRVKATLVGGVSASGWLDIF